MKKPKDAETKAAQIAKVMSALAHPARVYIVQILTEGARTVTSLQEKLGISQANLSQHLSLLRKAGIVGKRPIAAIRCYYLLHPKMMKDLLKMFEQEPKEDNSADEDIFKQAIKNAPESTGNLQRFYEDKFKSGHKGKKD